MSSGEVFALVALILRDGGHWVKQGKPDWHYPSFAISNSLKPNRFPGYEAAMKRDAKPRYRWVPLR